MQRGSNDAGLITDESGQVVAINLGWDAYAEHESGIKGLKQAFGVPTRGREKGSFGRIVEVAGADTRTITRVPEGFMFYANMGGYSYLFSDLPMFLWQKEVENFNEFLDRMAQVRGDEAELITAWDESAFSIRMKNEDYIGPGTTVLKEINEAFARRDIMIFLSGRDGPFANSGLVLAIRSRMPAEYLDKMLAVDLDYLDLLDAVDVIERETELKAKLKAAGQHYIALSPRWAKDFPSVVEGKTETEYPVIFWLNPYDQRNNNYGWFSVETLLLWVEDEGIIPKKNNPDDELDDLS